MKCHLRFHNVSILYYNILLFLFYFTIVGQAFINYKYLSVFSVFFAFYPNEICNPIPGNSIIQNHICGIIDDSLEKDDHGDGSPIVDLAISTILLVKVAQSFQQMALIE
jgi:hypothetical protein